MLHTEIVEWTKARTARVQVAFTRTRLVEYTTERQLQVLPLKGHMEKHASRK